MTNSGDNNNILSVLEGFIMPNAENVGLAIAADFRRRRIEKNWTREAMAQKADIALSNLVRFEQKGLISLTNLIKLAMAFGYLSEIKGLFAQPKYSTMDELTQIRANMHKKRAYGTEKITY